MIYTVVYLGGAYCEVRQNKMLIKYDEVLAWCMTREKVKTDIRLQGTFPTSTLVFQVKYITCFLRKQ